MCFYLTKSQLNSMIASYFMERGTGNTTFDFLKLSSIVLILPGLAGAILGVQNGDVASIFGGLALLSISGLSIRSFARHLGR